MGGKAKRSAASRPARRKGKAVGRRMKPIPDDAPAELAAFVGALRHLVEESLPEDVPTSALAEVAGVGRSTLFHALGGQRLPSQETLFALVDACYAARSEPDLVLRDSDGSVTEFQLKATSGTREVWQSAYERVRSALAVDQEPSVFHFLAHGVSEAQADQNYLVLPYDLASRATPTPDELAAAGALSEVTVADAAAALDAALQRLQLATTEVANARAMLRQALGSGSEKNRGGCAPARSRGPESDAFEDRDDLRGTR